MSQTLKPLLAPFRIGVDIGGTFTDLVMVDAQGQLRNEKVLTTPPDPSVGVLTGLKLILDNNGVQASDVQNVIHGTTLVANALIERKGVRTALITTSGFRDILQIGREWRYDIYDLFLTPVEPLVPRALCFEIKERVGYDGSVLTPLELTALPQIAEAIKQANVEAVAVCLLHSFQYTKHEIQLKEALAKLLPEVAVCISSEVMPEIGEYERTATTVCNAYVQPLFKKYISALMAGIKQLGIDQDLYLMQSDGGTVHFNTALEYPIRLVQSGPAGGVQATSLIGQMADLTQILCFDMGGTTAKACLIDEGKSAVTTDFEVARLQRFRKGSGIPLKVPSIDMIEIGSGGGSIARMNSLGLIQVGPDSSSAVPGPACYGQGGQEATVTDADLVLGYLDAQSFLGGSMTLDLAAARQCIQKQIAEPLEIAVTEAAFGIHETVNETMAQAASIHALEKGLKASSYAMIPIGGAGPVHACHVALKLGIERLVIPLGAGVASAFGFLASPMSFQFVQASVSPVQLLDVQGVDQLIEGLKKKGLAMLAESGLAAALCTSRVSAAMRYVGQGYEVEVPVSMGRLNQSFKQHLSEEFNRCYQHLYGRTEADTPAEIVSWRVVVQGPAPKLLEQLQANLTHTQASDTSADAAIKNRREVFCVFSRAFVQTPVYDRYALRSGMRFDGPAIVEERESTVVVPRYAKVKIDQHQNMLIDLTEPVVQAPQ